MHIEFPGKPTTPCMQQQPNNCNNCSCLFVSPEAVRCGEDFFFELEALWAPRRKPCNMKLNYCTEQRYAESVNSGRKMETIVKHRRTIGLNMSFFWLCRTMAASAMVTWPRWFFEVDWKVRLCKPVGCNPYLCPITACRKSMDWNIKLHIATSKTSSRTCFFWMLESSFVQLCSKALSWPDSLSRVAIPTWDTHSRRQMGFLLGLWMIILLLILHACKLETIRL